MKLSRYFEEQVLVRRPYLQVSWCERIVANPSHTEIQEDGRVRYWGIEPEFDGKWFRVVLESDGSLLNAFPDRTFKP